MDCSPKKKIQQHTNDILNDGTQTVLLTVDLYTTGKKLAFQNISSEYSQSSRFGTTYLQQNLLFVGEISL